MEIIIGILLAIAAYFGLKKSSGTKNEKAIEAQVKKRAKIKEKIKQVRENTKKKTTEEVVDAFNNDPNFKL